MRGIFLPLCLVWLLMVNGVALADTPSQTVLEETLAAMDRVMNPAPAEYFIKLTNEVPGKPTEEFILYAVNKENKWAGVITMPENLKGRAALRVNNQIWYHVPGEMTRRKGELSNSLISGVLEYRILFRIDDAPYYRPQLISAEDSRLAVQLVARTPNTNLPSRLINIDRRLFIPQTETLFSPSGTPLKEITYQDVRQFGSLPPRPARVVVKSLVNTGYTTTMTLGWIKTREIADQAFSTSFLPQIGTLLKSYQP